MRILLVEDDPLLGDGLRAGLRQQGFAVDWVRDGLAAERELRSGEYAAAVLDLGLPGQDGMVALRAARAQAVPTPVLVLTARDAVADRIAGLDAGADDYVLKPIDLLELGARLRALVRRACGQAQPLLCHGALTLDPGARLVRWHGEAVTLSQREFDLLHALLRAQGRVLTREQLETQLYAWGNEVESNTIEVHIHHLRKKLGPDTIHTVRGVGYALGAAQ
jgi:two-component system OmpR family response regulator/two-component system response regulator QseB